MKTVAAVPHVTDRIAENNGYAPRGILNRDLSAQTVTGIRLAHIRHVREWKIKCAALEDETLGRKTYLVLTGWK